MKKIIIFIQLSILIFTLSGCYTNVITDNNGNGGHEEGYGIIEVKGKIELEGDNKDVNNLFLETIYEESILSSEKFNIRSLSCDYPQLITVRDNSNGDIILMSRNLYNSTKTVIVDAQSTTIALVTLHPLFALIDKRNYSELVNLIVSSKHYSALNYEVKRTIENRQNIFDSENLSLVIALNNLYEDLCSEDSGIEGLARAAVISRSNLDIKDPYPFLVDASGNLLTIKNTALAPFYDGQVSHKMLGISELDIPTCDGYGGWALIKQAFGDLGVGDPIEYIFASEGEYKFHFSRTTPRAEFDFYYHLVKDLFNEIGIPLIEDAVIKDVVGKIQLEGCLVTKTTDPMDWITSASGIAITYLSSDLFKSSAHGIEFYKTHINAESFLKGFEKILKFWSIIKGSSNAILRIGWKFKSPENIDFCLCYYDGKVTSCTESSLRKVGGDNQEGFSNQRLLLPLKVYVTTVADDESYLEGSSYQKVKFEVISGGGNVSERIVGTDEVWQASTYWTLGMGQPGETQQVKAVVVDMVTGEEVSKPVYFTGKIKEPSDITVRLDWVKPAGDTDLDLHIIDPYGEEIYFSHPTSASGGWLDRDDVIGPGPEHIYWKSAPAGEYRVKVHHYDSESQSVISYTVTTFVNGKTYQNKGSVGYRDEVYVGSIIIPGNSTNSGTMQNSFVEKNEVYHNKVYKKK